MTIMQWRLVPTMAVAITASAWAGCCGGAVQAADEQAGIHEGRAEPDEASNPQLFDVDSHPYGLGVEVWAQNWLRWEYSIPAATNPAIVAGADYDQHQLGPVYFVPDGPNHDDAFTVSRHKALAVMLSQIGNDYPCPDPTFKPAPGQSLFAFLSTGLTQVNDNITSLEVTLDGRAIVDPLRHRYTSSRLFYFIGDPTLAASFDSCVTGTVQPTVADDLFLLFKPLRPGQHVLTTHIENKDGAVFDRTRTITVE